MEPTDTASEQSVPRRDFLAAVRRELYLPLDHIIGRSEMFLNQARELRQSELEAEIEHIHSVALQLYTLMRGERLPVAPPGPENGQSAMAGIVSPEIAVHPTQQNPLLVVDDRQTNRELLCEILKEQGHDVEAVEDGEAALEILRRKPFDLVLLDIMMPRMDGYEVLKHLKDDKELRHVPVIMLSGLDEINSVIRCIEMGAEDYLPKPFNPILLKARIDACLEKKKLRDQEQAYLKQLQIEREKAERLLLNILPKPIADRLKQGESIIVDSFTEASVLFADLADFTRLSGTVSPTDLVHRLNEIFSRFDRLAEKHGLEKIKTIGDAYMVAGGIPTPLPDHANAVADLALDMLEEMKAINREMGITFEIRVGINTGPLIAGIIGKNKFIYDLWGDTVNIASRMQSLGQVGAIQITESTRARLSDRFVVEERGVIEVKGKGEMMAYIIKGRKP